MFYLNKTKSAFYNVMCWVLPVASLAILILAYLRAVEANPVILPTPVEIWERFVVLLENPVKGVKIFGHIGTSLLRVLLGMVASWIFGFGFGILIGWNRVCNSLFGSIFNLLRPIPPIAWIPLIILIFGIGEFPKVLLVFISCAIPMVVNTFSGIRLVDPENVNVGKLFGASQMQILFHIVIPTALPSIFTGVRQTVDNGWKVILPAEMMGAAVGIGALVTRGWNELDMALVLVCVIAISVTGALLSIIILKVERMLSPWER